MTERDGELRREWLEPAIRGERIATLGVTEPGAGSDVASLQTVATVDGDDYLVRGAKIFISNGVRADFITLAVRTGGPGAEGLSLLICPTDARGFSVNRCLDKIDLHSSDTAELFFEDVRVPRRYLIGEEGRGFRYIAQAFQGERLVQVWGRISSSAKRRTVWRNACGRPSSRESS